MLLLLILLSSLYYLSIYKLFIITLHSSVPSFKYLGLTMLFCLVNFVISLLSICYLLSSYVRILKILKFVKSIIFVITYSVVKFLLNAINVFFKRS